MASCTCHVLCVTKRRRLERIVRPQHATTVRSTQALCLGCVRNRNEPARGDKLSAGNLPKSGLAPRCPVAHCLAGGEVPEDEQPDGGSDPRGDSLAEAQE